MNTIRHVVLTTALLAALMLSGASYAGEDYREEALKYFNAGTYEKAIEMYDKLIELIRKANINMLRVWGGGLREKRAFYDRCDEQGILVWQEFPFSGAPLDHLKRDAAFLDFTAWK